MVQLVVFSKKNCIFCKGSGSTTCSSCQGKGKDRDGDTCTTCDGKGTEDCSNCDGTGQVEDD